MARKHKHQWSLLVESGTGARQCIVNGCYETLIPKSPPCEDCGHAPCDCDLMTAAHYQMYGWTCPSCSHRFEHRDQPHDCPNPFPLMGVLLPGAISVSATGPVAEAIKRALEDAAGTVDGTVRSATMATDDAVRLMQQRLDELNRQVDAQQARIAALEVIAEAVAAVEPQAFAAATVPNGRYFCPVCKHRGNELYPGTTYDSVHLLGCAVIQARTLLGKVDDDGR